MQEFYDELYLDDFIPEEIADRRKALFIGERVRALNILNKEINDQDGLPVSDCLDMRKIIPAIVHAAERDETISEEEIRIAKLMLSRGWAEALNKAKGFFALAEHYPDKYFATVNSVNPNDQSLTLQHEGKGLIKIVRALPTTVGAISEDISKTCDRGDDMRFIYNGIILIPREIAVTDKQVILGLSEPYTP